MVLKYSIERLQEFIESTAVHGQRHVYYDHTIKVARFAMQIMTGDNQEDIIIEYKTKESDKAKKQRVRVTNSLTQKVANSVKSQYEELARVDNVVEQFYYGKDGEAEATRVGEIEDAINEFYQNDTLTKYLHEKVLHLNFYDPNSFIVCEAAYDPDDTMRVNKPTPYPLEIYSEQAVNYQFENGVLGWLIGRQITNFPSKHGQAKTVALPIFTLYAAEWTLQMQEINTDIVINEEDYAGWDLRNYTLDGGSQKTYLVKQYNTKLNVCPAIRVGYAKDPETNLNTCVTPLWPAEHIFRDMIWTKSEYDLCRALHGFYQKFIYAPVCNHTAENGQRCNRGRCGDDICPVCEGKGVLVHTTVQDVVVLEMPQNKAEAIPLSNFVHYEHIPMDLLRQHKEDLKDMESAVNQAIFQRDLMNIRELSPTATEIRDVQNSKYNVISTYGDNWSKVWIHLVNCVANYQGNEEGLIIEHDFSSDFIIETLTELYDQRQKAITANAPYSIIRDIDRKIMMKQNRGNILQVKKLDAKETWKPLREKSESERLSIMSNYPELHPLRIRYEYFEEIFAEIYAQKTDKPFHDLNWEAQKMIIDQIVNRLIEENRPYFEGRSQFRNIFDENGAA